MSQENEKATCKSDHGPENSIQRCAAVSEAALPAVSRLYIAAGITDMIDGTAARMTGSVSEAGSRLDTLADIVFTAACMIKLLPVLNVPVWAYCWAAVIALIKTVTFVIGYIRDKKLTAVHSLLNKITGAMLFAIPLTLSFIEFRYSTAAVCAMATYAAIHEGHCIGGAE